MLSCKRCRSQKFIKSGIAAGKQRYRCRHCNRYFREGDARTNDSIAAKKALCILLYAMAKVLPSEWPDIIGCESDGSQKLFCFLGMVVRLRDDFQDFFSDGIGEHCKRRKVKGFHYYTRIQKRRGAVPIIPAKAGIRTQDFILP